MKTCHHASWVEVSDYSGLRLLDPGRMDRLVNTLGTPKRQYPQTVACVGLDEKQRAMSHFFPRHAVAPDQSSRVFADLHLDDSRAHLEHPLLFVDCSPGARIPIKKKGRTCHQTKSVDTAQPLPCSEAQNVIISRLLLPFVDVVCIFADDFGSLETVATLLEEWTAGDVATTLPWKVRPRVSVVTFAPLTADALQEQKVFTSRLRTIRYRRHFSSVRLVRFWPRSTAAARDKALRRLVLHDDLEIIRAHRQSERTLFSAQHLSWFFSQAVTHVATAACQPFDFIATSRLPRPLPSHYPDLLRAFFRLAEEHQLTYDVIADVLASSVVLDAYPPSAHVFCPAHVFSTIYAAGIQAALEDEYIPSLAGAETHQRPGFTARCLSQILARVCEWTDAEAGAGEWAVRLHTRNLKRLQDKVRWEKVRSNFCGLFCLTDHPQHVLLCGHAICDTCVPRVGVLQAEQEYRYSLSKCPLCSTPSDLKIVLKPPTAGIRIFSVDGGGARGVVPLQLLRQLESIMGPDFRIQDYFDLGVGTSAGALIVIAMFRMRWDLARSTDLFCCFAHRIFSPPRGSRRGRRCPMPSYVRCLIGGEGLYSANDVPSLLQECLGENTRLLDCAVGGVSHCKFFVTTTVGDASTVVFPSYNLPSALPENSRPPGPEQAVATYRRFERGAPEVEPLLWEVAAATSAAPPYFSPVAIGQSEKHQDGGLRNPNPTDIAIEESVHIWPSQPRRDLVLSLGTGMPLDATDQSDSPSCWAFKDWAIFRILRWSRARLVQSVNAEAVHQNVLRMLHALDPPSVARYHRLNLQVPGSLPRLDDVSSMASLMSGVDQCRDDAKLQEIKLALVASSFFFELDGPPAYAPGGHYVCSGAIRIRGNAKSVLDVFRTVHAGRAQVVKDDEDLIDVQLDDGLCWFCSRYNQPIRFIVRKLTDTVTLSLRMGQAGEHRISGFPQTMIWFIVQQWLHDPFSQALPPSDICICRSAVNVEPLTVRKRTGSQRADSVSSKRRRKQSEVRCSA